MNRKHKSGIRKAAVLVASLDPRTADLLLERLPPQCAEQLRLAALDIDCVDGEEQQRVGEELCRIGVMVPCKCPPGIDLDGPNPPQRRPSNEEAAEFSGRQLNSQAGGQASLPFDFLHDVEPSELPGLLEGERPQTVALVLCHLSAERAGEMLAAFPPRRQTAILRCLIDLQHADPDSLREVEQTIQLRLSKQFYAKQQQKAGVQWVSRMLAASKPAVAGAILDSLAACDRSLAERFGHCSLEFDDLALCDEDLLRAVLPEVESAVLEAALFGAPTAVADRLLSCLDRAEARRLRRKLKHPDPIRISDVEEARCRIVALVRRVLSGVQSKTLLAA